MFEFQWEKKGVLKRGFQEGARSLAVVDCFRKKTATDVSCSGEPKVIRSRRRNACVTAWHISRLIMTWAMSKPPGLHMMIAYRHCSYECNSVVPISACFSFALQREKNSVCCWPMRQGELYLHFFFLFFPVKPVPKTRFSISFFVRAHSANQNRKSETFPGAGKRNVYRPKDSKICAGLSLLSGFYINTGESQS